MLDQDTPRTRRVRHDGWAPERQKEFIERLAETASVRDGVWIGGGRANTYVARLTSGG